MPWNCQNCGHANFADRWTKCEDCGSPRNNAIFYDEEEKRKLTEEQRKKEELEFQANFPVVTTHTIEGWKIIRYFGIVNSIVAVGTGFWSELTADVADIFGSRASGYQDKLRNATKLLIKELIEEAVQKSPDINGLLGLKLDYTVAGRNLMILSGTATAVMIEKIQE